MDNKNYIEQIKKLGEDNFSRFEKEVNSYIKKMITAGFIGITESSNNHKIIINEKNIIVQMDTVVYIYNPINKSAFSNKNSKLNKDEAEALSKILNKLISRYKKKSIYRIRKV